MQMLDSFILPSISQWDNYEWLHFMHDGATPHFAPPVYVWLDNHFPGWWTGNLRTNKIACGKSWSYCTWLVFVELGPKRKSTNQNWENKMNWNNKCEILCHGSLLTSKHKKSLRLQKWVQNNRIYIQIIRGLQADGTNKTRTMWLIQLCTKYSQIFVKLLKKNT